MLDEKDIQMIKEIVDGSVAQAEQRITKSTEAMVAQAEQRITKSTVALMDLEFSKKFNILAENQQLMLEMMRKLVPEERMERVEGDVEILKTAVRANRQDIDKLKEVI